MLLIGDVHGKRKPYRRIVKAYEGLTVQIGDFGFYKDHNRHLKYGNPTKDKVLFGNHDDYAFVNRKHSLGDFGMYEGMFFVRGAFSIDQWHRTEGVSWWREEEMEYGRMLECFDAYVAEKPSFVISHDCPRFLYDTMMSVNGVQKSRTNTLLQNMWEAHQPERWVFGHHHKSVTLNVKGTEFTCLDELETLEV